MMNTKLRDAFRFFFEHAGYCVGHRAEGALALARAEARAREIGIEFEWNDDNEALDHLGSHDFWCPAERREQAGYDRWGERIGIMPRLEQEYHEHTVQWCAASLPGFDPFAASLGGIVDADRDYRRVVEAELSQEALDEWDRLTHESVYWLGEPLEVAS